jgi:hypothetical protein
MSRRRRGEREEEEEKEEEEDEGEGECEAEGRNSKDVRDARSGRKQKRSGDEEENEIRESLFKVCVEDLSMPTSFKVVSISKRDEKAKSDFAKDAEDICKKAVVRLFLTKGCKREVVKRKDVADVLDKIDSTYKKHASYLIAEAKKELELRFGYSIINGQVLESTTAEEKELNKSKKDDFYVINNIK